MTTQSIAPTLRAAADFVEPAPPKPTRIVSTFPIVMEVVHHVDVPAHLRLRPMGGVWYVLDPTHAHDPLTGDPVEEWVDLQEAARRGLVTATPCGVSR
jgi:hypothetical protein